MKLASNYETKYFKTADENTGQRATPGYHCQVEKIMKVPVYSRTKIMTVIQIFKYIHTLTNQINRVLDAANKFKSFVGLNI